MRKDSAPKVPALKRSGGHDGHVRLTAGIGTQPLSRVGSKNHVRYVSPKTMAGVMTAILDGRPARYERASLDK